MHLDYGKKSENCFFRVSATFNVRYLIGIVLHLKAIADLRV
jgi:hypothetical protein